MKRSNITLGKRKEVDALMTECAFTQPALMGPYTMIEASLSRYGRIITGHGLARRGPDDKPNPPVGVAVAKHRAVCAIVCKLKRKHPHHPLMG